MWSHRLTFWDFPGLGFTICITGNFSLFRHIDTVHCCEDCHFWSVLVHSIDVAFFSCMHEIKPVAFLD